MVCVPSIRVTHGGINSFKSSLPDILCTNSQVSKLPSTKNCCGYLQLGSLLGPMKNLTMGAIVIQMGWVVDESDYLVSRGRKGTQGGTSSGSRFGGYRGNQGWGPGRGSAGKMKKAQIGSNGPVDILWLGVIV